MRKNRGKATAVFTAFAVILAAGVSSTEQISVVYAEEEEADRSEDLTAQGGDDQTATQDATGNDMQGESGNTRDVGTETDNDETDVGMDTDNDETDVGTDTDNVTDDASDETEEDEVLLTSGISTFSLQNSGSAEIVSEEIKTMDELNKLLEEHIKDTPVKAILSADIEAAQPIQLSKKLILDMNNHTINASSTAVSVEDGGYLTITGSGRLSSGTGNTIEVTEGTLVLENGEIIAESRSDGNVIAGAISVGSSGKAEINGGTVSGKGYAIAIRGGEVEIKGGTVKAEPSGEVHAIHVNSGSLTVSGGSIIGNGGEASGALFMQGGSAEIKGGSLKTTVTAGYGFTCYATGSSSLTITGGNFTLDASAGKSLYIGSGVTAAVSGGSYNGRGIGINTGADSDNPTLGGWADSFYDKLGGGILSNNTFCKEGSVVYTNPSVSVKSGTWNRACKEMRDLTTGTQYSFGSEGWTIAGDSSVYGSGSFYAAEDGSYTFNRK